MSSDLITFVLPVYGLIVIVDLFFLYGAYLSISVWRGLAVPIYRSRAFWMALFGIPLVLTITYDAVTATLAPSSPLAAPIIPEILFTFPLVGLLVWIDRTVNSVIHLDYLRRDIFAWRKSRLLYWGLVVAGNVTFFSHYLIDLPYSQIVANAFISGPLLYGVASMAKGSSTTRDATFRSHIRWFGYMGAFFIPAILLYGFFRGLNIPSLLLLTGAAYCFYQMAKHLVPAGKLIEE